MCMHAGVAESMVTMAWCLSCVGEEETSQALSGTPVEFVALGGTAALARGLADQGPAPGRLREQRQCGRAATGGGEEGRAEEWLSGGEGRPAVVCVLLLLLLLLLTHCASPAVACPCAALSCSRLSLL